MPYAPALIMTPESRALAGAGATGCARGSHTCTGTMPALTPKPSTIRPAAMPRSLLLPASSGSGANAPPPTDCTSRMPASRATPPSRVIQKYCTAARRASAVPSCTMSSSADSPSNSKNR